MAAIFHPLLGLGTSECALRGALLRWAFVVAWVLRYANHIVDRTQPRETTRSELRVPADPQTRLFYVIFL